MSYLFSHICARHSLGLPLLLTAVTVFLHCDLLDFHDTLGRQFRTSPMLASLVIPSFILALVGLICDHLFERSL